MRHWTSWLLSVGVVAGLGASASTSFAQPNVRDHRNPPPAAPPPAAPPPGEHDRDHDRDHDRRTPPPGEFPTEAPPAPRIEKLEARAGFVYVNGRWDWRNHKWEWINGHWERERPGKRWNQGHWDRNGDRWVFTDGGWGDGGGLPPPPSGPAGDDRPHAPPPPPRDERPEQRPGFVFVKGRWDWRGRNWAWTDGHFERERAGKQWRDSRWEQREGAWLLIDGDLVDTGIVPQGPNGAPPPPPPEDRGPPREWRMDRPVISSYWPIKGKIGSRITIRGRNFPPDTSVTWNGQQINGARITPDEVIVAVPPGAVSGAIQLNIPGRRELWVGNYEVAADYDAEAEARRLADEARLKAQQDWEIRQRALAKDRAARLASFERQERELEESRAQRRQDRLRDLRARWEAAFLADADTQAELTLHAQRVAEIERMREIADLTENGKLAVRIGVVASREDQRHQGRMDALHDSFGRK